MATLSILPVRKLCRHKSYFTVFLYLDTTVEFSNSIYSVDEDSGSARLLLLLSNPPSTNITIEVFNTNITALGKLSNIIYTIILFCDMAGGGIDYNSGPYNVTIPAKERGVFFSVFINDDKILEDNETFNLTINSSSLPDRVIVTNLNKATVIIEDNDGKYVIYYYKYSYN